jgi:hypothetical protein
LDEADDGGAVGAPVPLCGASPQLLWSVSAVTATACWSTR